MVVFKYRIDNRAGYQEILMDPSEDDDGPVVHVLHIFEVRRR